MHEQCTVFIAFVVHPQSDLMVILQHRKRCFHEGQNMVINLTQSNFQLIRLQQNAWFIIVSTTTHVWCPQWSIMCTKPSVVVISIIPMLMFQGCGTTSGAGTATKPPGAQSAHHTHHQLQHQLSQDCSCGSHRVWLTHSSSLNHHWVALAVQQHVWRQPADTSRRIATKPVLLASKCPSRLRY